MIRILKQFKDRENHYKILLYNDNMKNKRIFGEYFSYNDMIKGIEDSEYLFKEEKQQKGYQFTIYDL